MTAAKDDGFDYEVTIHPDALNPRDSFDEESDVEWVAEQLRAGNMYAWCWVHVRATERNPPPGCEPRVGEASVGGCSYKSREDLDRDVIEGSLKPEARAMALDGPPHVTFSPAEMRALLDAVTQYVDNSAECEPYELAEQNVDLEAARSALAKLEHYAIASAGVQ